MSRHTLVTGLHVLATSISHLSVRCNQWGPTKCAAPTSQCARYAWLQQNEPKIAAGWPHGVVCGIPKICWAGEFENEVSWMPWSTPSYDVFAASRLKLSGEPVQKTNQLFEAKPGQISMGPQAAGEK